METFYSKQLERMCRADIQHQRENIAHLSRIGGCRVEIVVHAHMPTVEKVNLVKQKERSY